MRVRRPLDGRELDGHAADAVALGPRAPLGRACRSAGLLLETRSPRAVAVRRRPRARRDGQAARVSSSTSSSPFAVGVTSPRAARPSELARRSSPPPSPRRLRRHLVRALLAVVVGVFVGVHADGAVARRRPARVARRRRPRSRITRRVELGAPSAPTRAAFSARPRRARRPRVQKISAALGLGAATRAMGGGGRVLRREPHAAARDAARAVGPRVRAHLLEAGSARGRRRRRPGSSRSPISMNMQSSNWSTSPSPIVVDTSRSCGAYDRCEAPAERRPRPRAVSARAAAAQRSRSALQLPLTPMASRPPTAPDRRRRRARRRAARREAAAVLHAAAASSTRVTALLARAPRPRVSRGGGLMAGRASRS